MAADRISACGSAKRVAHHILHSYDAEMDSSSKARRGHTWRRSEIANDACVGLNNATRFAVSVRCIRFRPPGASAADHLSNTLTGRQRRPRAFCAIWNSSHRRSAILPFPLLLSLSRVAYSYFSWSDDRILIKTYGNQEAAVLGDWFGNFLIRTGNE